MKTKRLEKKLNLNKVTIINDLVINKGEMVGFYIPPSYKSECTYRACC